MTTATTTHQLTALEGLRYVETAPGVVAFGLNVWDYDEPTATWMKRCVRCAGTGYTPFEWVQNGICFKCNGGGVQKNVNPATDATVMARARAYNARRIEEDKRFKEEQAREAERAAAREAERIARIAAREAERATRADFSDYIAEEGEKVEGEGEIVYTKFLTTTYGYRETDKRLFIVRLDDGRSVKTFTTARWAFEQDDEGFIFDRGARIRFTGTVKANEEYRGERASLLTRVKAELI